MGIYNLKKIQNDLEERIAKGRLYKELINNNVAIKTNCLSGDNAILEFSSATYPEASLNFFVRNNTSEVIMVRAEVTNVSGTDGTYKNESDCLNSDCEKTTSTINCSSASGILGYLYIGTSEDKSKKIPDIDIDQFITQWK